MFSTAPKRLRPILSLVVGLLALAFLATAAPSADAALLSRSGYAGSVGAPVATIDHSHFGNSLTVAWRNVTESPAYAAHDQYVCVVHRIFTGGTRGPRWTQANAVRNCAWIPRAGTSVAINGVNWSITPMHTYRVTTEVTWQLANGSLIGRANQDYAHASDYRCLDTLDRCQVLTTTWGGTAAWTSL